MRRLGIFAGLALTACNQFAAVTAFEQRAAPQIASACAQFHQAEADPLVQLALAGGSAAGGPTVASTVASIKSFGDAFCLNGPPAGDTTSVAQQLVWLIGVADQMYAAAGAK